MKTERKIYIAKQRCGKDPDIKIIRTRYLPERKADKIIITKEQLHNLKKSE